MFNVFTILLTLSLIITSNNHNQVNCFWLFSPLSNQHIQSTSTSTTTTTSNNQQSKSWINLGSWIDPITTIYTTYFDLSSIPSVFHLYPPLPYHPPYSPSLPFPPSSFSSSSSTPEDKTTQFFGNSICPSSLSSSSRPSCTCDGPESYPIVTCSSLSSSYLINNLAYSSLGRLTLYNQSIDSNFLLTINKPIQHLRLSKLTGLNCPPASSSCLSSILSSSLRRLEIISCNLNTFPFSSLSPSSYPNLKDIDLRQNGLKLIPDYGFPFNPIIQTIDLSYNNLTYLGSYAFTQLINLKQLILSHNQLKILNNYALAGNPINTNKNNQLIIDLTYNQLFHCAIGSFDNLNPVYLDLRYNSLVSLSEDVFNQLIVTMSRNEISSTINVKHNRFQCNCPRTQWIVQLKIDQKKVIHGYHCNINGNEKSLLSLTLNDINC
ncbi:toll-like receptor 3 [Panonychus citri]|uniref:toll-like receptor 3 n=1 Tax=Panonychus citri TaxID=50023 RepID=UPI0023074D63|nr:toll-like receptor 3 [Panonychus citri]